MIVCVTERVSGRDSERKERERDEKERVLRGMHKKADDDGRGAAMASF